jgi:hypothetical protein
MDTGEAGRGRVFVLLADHSYFTLNDPYSRMVLLRAMT